MSIETMTKLATTTVGAGGTSTVTFSNIPQTYTDLVLLISARTDGSEVDRLINLTFNGSTSGYSTRELLANPTTVSSLSWSSAAQIYLFQMAASSATANTFGNIQAYIPNYAGSNYKSLSCDGVTETNATSGTNRLLSLSASLWQNTAAITSMTLTPQAGNFVQYTTATLYGIKNARKTAGNSIKATGGNISFDGTYVVHTFTSSGTFTPTVALPDVDYLVVAGGGGGGAEGGGGGGGGLRSTVTSTGGGGSLESALSLTANSNYTVTVGAGGTAGTSGTSGGNGSDSVFSTITSTGGGGGGAKGQSGANQSGKSGGSGGGASRDAGVSTGGTGTANQGYAGGGSNGTGDTNAGGGGGAGAVGQSAQNPGSGGAAGNGGAGVSVSITGSSSGYAGGGGGGALNNQTRGTATDGGGDGGNASNASTSGTANRGGGGGGGGYNDPTSSKLNGSSGGSGVVIIRYKA